MGHESPDASATFYRDGRMPATITSLEAADWAWDLALSPSA
jgi:hypothetical protein